MLLKNNNDTALLIIDIQEKITPVMDNKALLIKSNQILIQGFECLNLPIYYTEQYPKGLGNTIKELETLLVDKSFKYEKENFSAKYAGSLIKDLKNKLIKNIVLTGIESHICVLQTAFDLIDEKFNVFLAVDAISSRKILDFKYAIKRMRGKGVNITTTESILFEIIEKSSHEKFKLIAKFIR